jgi:hypothetical protein
MELIDSPLWLDLRKIAEDEAREADLFAQLQMVIRELGVCVGEHTRDCINPEGVRLNEFIESSFSWAESPQGTAFWDALHLRLIRKRREERGPIVPRAIFGEAPF